MRGHGTRRALLGAASLLAIGSLSCGAADEPEPPAPERTQAVAPDPAFRTRGVTVVVPDGWVATRRRPSTILDPRPLLTAASYDLDPKRPTSCTPKEALEQKPPGGALVVVWRNGFDHGRLRDVSPRPGSFSLSPKNRGNFDCSGHSYAISYREGGRIFGINVWLDPRSTSPETRREAEDLLNSLELATE